ncbi:MAG TPA: hypothetical protein VG796_19535 [Verrucomicrobiales bacterium]|nr:hypothetical protein [Verrucomicrobiales bacterium]
MNQPAPTLNTALRPIPLWLKLACTAFVAVFLPVYWHYYGPTNFLYFCDIALLLALTGMWTGNALLISMCCVGILLPQALWCVDFIVVLCGGHLTGMTEYMVKDTSLFLRGLSLFHGWLPFLLFYLVRRTGYDRRALPLWTALAWVLCLICYFMLPGPANIPGDLTPRNVNFVFGMSETEPQTFMPPSLYFILWLAVLPLAVYLPTHFLLRRFIPAPRCA